jgi:hypothetical protein
MKKTCGNCINSTTDGVDFKAFHCICEIFGGFRSNEKVACKQYDKTKEEVLALIRNA